MYKIVYSREVVVNTCDASIAICHTKRPPLLPESQFIRSSQRHQGRRGDPARGSSPWRLAARGRAKRRIMAYPLFREPMSESQAFAKAEGDGVKGSTFYPHERLSDSHMDCRDCLHIRRNASSRVQVIDS